MPHDLDSEKSSRMSLEPESDSIPLQHQCFFGGAGLKRKRIDFVREFDARSEVKDRNYTKHPVGDLYPSIVRLRPPPSPSQRDATLKDGTSVKTTSAAVMADVDSNSTLQHRICPTCSLPLVSKSAAHDGLPHELTLGHQLSLPHSHPPSALDRRSKGLAYMSAHGWDPDMRIGLGAAGMEGRLDPVKVVWRETNDRSGIGIKNNGERQRERKAVEAKENKEKAEKTRVGQKELKKRKQDEDKRLRALVYGRDDVNQYLGIEL